jgi:hypothetical protein
MLRFPESWQICQSADVTQPLEKLLPPLKNERRLATLEGVLNIIRAVIGTRHTKPVKPRQYHRRYGPEKLWDSECFIRVISNSGIIAK